MKQFDFCNCDPSHLPASIEVSCCQCGYTTFCEHYDLDDEGLYHCDDCRQGEEE